MDLEPHFDEAHFEEPEEKMEMDAAEDPQDQDLDIDVETPAPAKDGYNEDNAITIDDDELLEGGEDQKEEEELGYESNQDESDDISVERHVEEIESSSEEDLEQKMHLIKSYPIIVTKDDMDGSFFLFSCYESEDTEDAPVLLDEVDALNMPMEDIFGSLRQAFEKFDVHISVEDELIFYFPQMQLRIQEDNFYSKEVTMNDIFEVFCELVSNTPEQDRPVALDVQLTLSRRFISVFNALSERIREDKGFPDVSFGQRHYEEPNDGERNNEEGNEENQNEEEGVEAEGPEATEPEETKPEVEAAKPAAEPEAEGVHPEVVESELEVEEVPPEVEEVELEVEEIEEVEPEVEEIEPEVEEFEPKVEEIQREENGEPEVTEPVEIEVVGLDAVEEAAGGPELDEEIVAPEEVEEEVDEPEEVEEIDLATEEDEKLKAQQAGANGKETAQDDNSKDTEETAGDAKDANASFDDKASTTEGEDLLPGTNDPIIPTDDAAAGIVSTAEDNGSNEASPTNKRPLELDVESPQKKTKSD
ncbi:hypothetical protein TRVA0_002S05094 [Trichomonascus vanleenenianus]|uniref:Rmr1p n=1 Tax=Trichomonascus vanleenenianus TaxID=2268995 RepID=UPI003ECAA410